jgi:hypothetical protein
MSEAPGQRSRNLVTARVCRPNASERRANLEKDDVQADAIVESGKADMDGQV